MMPDLTFAKVVHLNFIIPLKRRFSPSFLANWNEIKNEIAHMVRHYDVDVVSWSLTPNKTFSTKSMYVMLENGIIGPNDKKLWKSKLPLKIKVFMWQVYQYAILTRENMRKKDWLRNPKCSFCENIETQNHLFFTCSIAKSV
jgi:hypothetical protein